MRPRLRSYTANSPRLGAYLKPNQLISNYIILELARGKAQIPSYAPLIRNSALPAQEYRRLGAMFFEAYRPSNSPAELWELRQTAERHRLRPTYGRGPNLGMCTFLHAKGILLPADLRSLPPGRLWFYL